MGKASPKLLKLAGVLLALLAVGFGLLWWYASRWGQDADPDFDATVMSPAFGTAGPTVYFDQAHFNAHSLQTTYAPFGAVLRNDGFRMAEGREPLGLELLETFDILVIVNARGSAEAGHRGDPAFAATEIDAVYDWVVSGGSFLLIADHAPFGSAARAMAAKFGVHMSNVDTIDPTHHDTVSGNEGFLMFSRRNRLLSSHPILDGRTPNERISRVLTFNGQSLEAPDASTALLPLSDDAKDRAPDGSEQPATGRVQGLALEVGKGRVVVLGEAAMLTAQVARIPFQDLIYAGMNRADVDNKQLTLNIMHWLARLIG